MTDNERTLMMFSNLFPEKIDVTERIDSIENAVYKQLKEFGFKKHGRTLHRFVSEDISQVINFQCGQPYRNETHLMWVNIGIRVPESFERKFEAVNSKKYYHEYECNIRTRLGMVKLKDSNKATTYDLRKSIDHMTANIVEEILEDVLPVFEILNSRESIIAHRREYPWFDTLNSRLILLEESMIYGHMGDKKKAKECFDYCLKTSSPHGFLAEQIDNKTMKSDWVIGLGWSHAMFIIVLKKMLEQKII